MHMHMLTEQAGLYSYLVDKLGGSGSGSPIFRKGLKV